MDAEATAYFQEAAASNLWGAILPEMLVAFLALSLLALEMFLPENRRHLIPRVAIWGQAAILAWFLGFYFQGAGGHLGTVTFAGMLSHSLFGQAMRAFFLLASLFVCFLASISLARQQTPKVEFYHITLVVTAAMMLLVQSHHFVMLFVALETVTVGFFILVSYFRNTSASLEAGLKFLILGALSSSLLLFGIVLLYGAGGNPELAGHTGNAMAFDQLRSFLEQNPDHFLVISGSMLVVAGLAFKIAAVPFQIWVPDVYQGAPTPVTAFLAVSSKAAGFAVLLVLATTVFQPLSGVLLPVLTVMAILTILFGNLAALNQRNVKRLMGLSGISHAGYLLLGVAAAMSVPWATGAVVFYLFVYMLASFAVFGVMVHLSGPNDSQQELEHYAELSKTSPFLTGVLIIGLGSLAGIPPLAGFIGKLLLFVAAFQAELYGLLAVAIIGVIISIYYYFGWMKVATFRVWRPAAPGEKAVPPAAPVISLVSRLTLGGIAAATVLLGFFQGPLAGWLRQL